MRDRILRIDDRAVAWIAIRRHPIVDPLMKIASHIGDGPAWFILALLMVVSGVEGREGAFRLGVSFLLNLSMYKILKTCISRPRPFERILVVQRKADIPDEFSFPSGHTAAAFVAAVVAGSTFSWLLAPLLLLAIAIGSSRVYLGMHYPSDVLAGAVLGSSAGAVGLLIV